MMIPLPKFILGHTPLGPDPREARHFVVHLHAPRFVLEVGLIPPAAIEWLEPPIFDPDHGTPAEQESALLRSALEFHEESLPS